ncbi:hypothetical protein D770_12500 [Flammeovirgaceae bacterium 311]|nr:hypothetical protein D770_12500 [Flammeovirgaceae bacterium 311]
MIRIVGLQYGMLPISFFYCFDRLHRNNSIRSGSIRSGSIRSGSIRSGSLRGVKPKLPATVFADYIIHLYQNQRNE